MIGSRATALAATIALVAAACSAAPAAVPSARGSSEGPATSPPSPSSTGPDLTRLRVTTNGWATDFSVASVDLGEFFGGGPPKDGIPAIDNPQFESIGDALSWLSPQSPVIALEVGGAARAYPLAILIWHEIVNDTLGGVPVVATFCPLCHTALVFERARDGTIHDFGTTGNLRYSDLVMYDRQTESWWQQATGEAIVGTLTGAKLAFLPAQIVSVADFGAAYPGGDVLSRDTGMLRNYGQNPYPGYDQADQQPFLFGGFADGRLAPKERVVTLELRGRTLAVPYPLLEAEGVVRIADSDKPIAVFWTSGTSSSLDTRDIDAGRDSGATGVFVAEVDGGALTFSRDGDRDGPIVDAETGSTWSVTGHAIAGPLAGSQLDPGVHGDHFWFAWAAFEPETEIWSGS